MRQCEYFRNLSKARMREIDEIRASGGQTELEKWWKSSEENAKHNLFRKWKDEDIAYIVQRRPDVAFKDIASCIGKSISSCSRKYREVQEQGKLDYYMNYKLETLNGDDYEI